MEANQNNDRRFYPLKLLVIPGVVLLSQLLFSILSQPDTINHDCAFILHGAQLILDGRHPMSGFLDMAPPITFYALVPFCFLCQSFALPLALTWNLLCWGFICATYILAILIVEKDADKHTAMDWLMVGPLFCGFLLWNLVMSYHLGQREHLFVLTFFLFFLLRWKRLLGLEVDKRIAIGTGIACGFICFVKPYFCTTVFALELYWFLNAVLRKRRANYALLRAQEVLAFVAIGAACPLVSFAIPNIGEYYDRIIPLVVNGYQAFDVSKAALFSFESIHGQLVGNRLVVIAFVLLGLFLIRTTSLLAPLLVWTISGFAIYALQGKGWAYHSIPMVAGYYLTASIVVGMSAIYLLRGLSRLNKSGDYWSSKTINTDKNHMVLSQSAVIAFLFYGALSIPFAASLIHNSSVSAKILPVLDTVIARETKPKDNVLILTTNFSAAFPVVLQMQRRQAARYLWCFNVPMVEMLRKGPDREKWDGEYASFIKDVVADIRNSKPKLIAFDKWNESLHRDLFQDPAVSEVLNGYEPLRGENGFALWKLK